LLSFSFSFLPFHCVAQGQQVQSQQSLPTLNTNAPNAQEDISALANRLYALLAQQYGIPDASRNVGTVVTTMMNKLSDMRLRGLSAIAQAVTENPSAASIPNVQPVTPDASVVKLVSGKLF
jgi:predicted solute-binding protein